MAAKCELPLIPPRVLSIAPCKHARQRCAYLPARRDKCACPIRPPRPTCANQRAWAFVAPRRPKPNSTDTAALSDLTRMHRPHGCIFPGNSAAPLIRLWPSYHYDFGATPSYQGQELDDVGRWRCLISFPRGSIRNQWRFISNHIGNDHEKDLFSLFETLKDTIESQWVMNHIIYLVTLHQFSVERGECLVH